MEEIKRIKDLFKKQFPHYPVLAIWDAGDSYLVNIEIKSGIELADGCFKVSKSSMKLDEKWGYQQHLEEFKRITSRPAIYIRKESS